MELQILVKLALQVSVSKEIHNVLMTVEMDYIRIAVIMKTAPNAMLFVHHAHPLQFAPAALLINYYKELLANNRKTI